MGLEPMASSLARRHSTTELPPRELSDQCTVVSDQRLSIKKTTFTEYIYNIIFQITELKIDGSMLIVKINFSLITVHCALITYFKWAEEDLNLHELPH